MRLLIEPSSIRYQISLRLLLSALNGILLVGLMVVFLASRPTAEEASRTAMVISALQDFSRDHARFVHEGVLWDMEEDLADLERELEALEPIPTQAMDALANYRLALEDEPDLPDRIRSTQDIYPMVVEEVRLAILQRDKPFFERHHDWTIALLAWTTLVAVLMVAESIRLQKIFSTPISRLAAAALDVADGRLDRPIEVTSRATEISQLARALESMRLALVRLIGRLDVQNAEMSTMLAALDDGVILVDPDGIILEANARAHELLADMGGDCARMSDHDARDTSGGARPSETAGSMEGRSLSCLLPPPPGGSDPEPRRPASYLHSFDSVTGRRHVQVSTEILSDQESRGSRARVVVLRDITRSIEIDQMKRSFLSVVTHELKTPLTVIDGYVRLLLMGKGGSLAPKQTEMLEKTRDQAALLGRMVQDLLDTTRIESGKLSLDLGRIEARRAIVEVTDAFASEAGMAGLTLEADDTPASLHVQADTQRLGQILSNLVRNAIKFTPTGGRVRLRAEAGEGLVHFIVEDSGRGIPAAALPHVFDKFYQVEQGDTRKAGGAGLGLFICQQLALAMGGRVEVRSEPGSGSRFTVTLPSAPRG